MSWIDGILITFISKLEWGTVADWVSGIGSLIAIAFAYWQIAEQRKEYEEDKKEKASREILANRPFFSLMKLLYLKEGKDHLWLTGGDNNLEKINNILKKNSELKNGISEYEFKNGISAYEFKNVSQAIATNVVLKIEYQNEASDEVFKTDFCKIVSCVIGNERAIMLPHSILNEPSTYSYCPKNVYLYFTTIDDRAYRQKWTEKIDKSHRVEIEQVDIIEISKEEIPDEGSSSCMDM